MATEVMTSEQIKASWAQQGIQGPPDDAMVAAGDYNHDEKGYHPAPAGDYVGIVTDWGFDPELKVNNWKGESYECYSLVLFFEVAEGPYTGFTARDYLPFPNNPDNKPIFGPFATRLGHAIRNIMGIKPDDKRLAGNRMAPPGWKPDDLKGKKVRFTIDLYNDKPRMKMYSYLPYVAPTKSGSGAASTSSKSPGGSPHKPGSSVGSTVPTTQTASAASEVEV